MQLAPEQIAHIATLARLELSAAEAQAAATQLSGILSYVGKLQEVDTSKVKIDSATLVNRYRDDQVMATPPSVRDVVVEQFPERVDDLNQVKAVF